MVDRTDVSVWAKHVKNKWIDRNLDGEFNSRTHPAVSCEPYRLVQCFNVPARRIGRDDVIRTVRLAHPVSGQRLHRAMRRAILAHCKRSQFYHNTAALALTDATFSDEFETSVASIAANLAGRSSALFRMHRYHGKE